jgi:4,5-dihydroxyphthalate decarboxylase
LSAPLHLALGRTPRTEAVFAPGMEKPGGEKPGMEKPGGAFNLAPLGNITRAFAPMVRDGAYDASEMAIATFIMAKAAGKPLVLLPAILTSRHPQASLLARVDGPVPTVAALRGRRVGVRAYSQTTGLWLRGILADAHGLPADAMRWVTFEDAHLAEYQDPPWAERAPPGADMLAMLRDGSLDAAIFGSDAPQDAALVPVFPDAPAAGQAFLARHGFTPLNHLLVARADVAQTRTDALADLLARLRDGGCAVPSRAGLDPALALAARYCHAQGLTPRLLTPDDLWNGTPPQLLG